MRISRCRLETRRRRWLPGGLGLDSRTGSSYPRKTGDGVPTPRVWPRDLRLSSICFRKAVFHVETSVRAGARGVSRRNDLDIYGIWRGFRAIPTARIRPRSRALHAKAEAEAIAVPTPESARSWLRTLTEEPHVAGTPADYKTAPLLRRQASGVGLEGRPVRVRGAAQLPRQNHRPRRPERQRPARDPADRDLPLFEKPIAGDKDSASRDAFTAFHGYGISGPRKVRSSMPTTPAPRTSQRSKNSGST